MSRRKKGLVVFFLVVAAVVVAAGVSIAQSGGSGDSPESPETGERGVGAPKGPFIDFCPTREQTQAHLNHYGFDYKPTVACTRQGEPLPPTVDQRAESARDPDKGLSANEACKRDKQQLESARTSPDTDGDPNTLYGKLPDGTEIIVGIMGRVEKGWTIRDEAGMITCSPG